jgi:hypothetical protein
MTKPKRARAPRSKPMEVTAKEGTQLRPRLLLRVEGFLVLVGSVVAYSQTGHGWGLFILAFFLPDLGLLGYLKGHGLGAWLYNFSHSTILPLIWGLWLWHLGPLDQSAVWMPVLWLAHIGWDRMLGFGLQYPADFKITHLQKI